MMFHDFYDRDHGWRLLTVQERQYLISSKINDRERAKVIDRVHKWRPRRTAWFECMNARLGRLDNWKAHRLLFHFDSVARISHKISLKSSILLGHILRQHFLTYLTGFPLVNERFQARRG